MAICEVLIALVTCFGVFTYRETIRRENIRDARDAVARLYKLDLDANNTLGATPKALMSLYDDPVGNTYSDLLPEEKSVFQDACATLGGVFEYYLLIKDDIQYLPNSKQITESWDGYMKTAFQKSCGFRGQIKANRNAWTPMLLDEVRKDTFGLDFPLGDQ